MLLMTFQLVDLAFFDYNEKSIDLIWVDANKSKLELNENYNNTGKPIFDIIIEIIRDNDHINLILK